MVTIVSFNIRLILDDLSVHFHCLGFRNDISDCNLVVVKQPDQWSLSGPEMGTTALYKSF